MPRLQTVLKWPFTRLERGERATSAQWLARAWVATLLCGTLAAGAVTQQRPANPPTARPNILFISADDLNDWVGCLGGHPQVRTPNLDALAARGLLFANAHCQAPLCVPSRNSLLTGLRPSTLGSYSLGPWVGAGAQHRDWPNLPALLADNGYDTHLLGKVFHDGCPNANELLRTSRALNLGTTAVSEPAPPRPLSSAAPNTYMDWGEFPEDERKQPDWKIATAAVKSLEKVQEPFFLGVGFRRPHLPMYASRKWFDLYPANQVAMPPVNPSDRDDTPRFSWFLHWKVPEPRMEALQQAGEWRSLVRAYLASVSFMDSQVGRVLAGLQASGKADRTIVIFYSDHGWHLGEKGITGKNSLWERSTRVPLIITGPGVTAGGRCSRPVELLDLYPTVSELCQVTPPNGLEGHSLRPFLRNPKAARPWPAITTHGPGNHSIRSERWRYIHYADGSEELYDLRLDPNEWTNRALDPRYGVIKSKLAVWVPRRDEPPLPGSRLRLVDRRNGAYFWEARRIPASGPVPGFEQCWGPWGQRSRSGFGSRRMPAWPPAFKPSPGSGFFGSPARTRPPWRSQPRRADNVL